MKFRAVANTDLVISEVALDLDGSAAVFDPASAERLLRQAYDEGINFFLVSRLESLGGALGAAFGGDRRSKVSIAVRKTWSGDVDRLAHQLEEDLQVAGIERADVLFVAGLQEADLHSGLVGDAVHRLRATGRVGLAGTGQPAGLQPPVSLAERNGFAMADERPLIRHSLGEERGLPAIVHAPDVATGPHVAALEFLWQDTGRTAGQTGVQLVLAMPGACAASIRPASAAELKELARAPLAPPLLPAEIGAAWDALLQPATGEPVNA